MSGCVVGIDPSMTATGIAILRNPRLVTGKNVPELKTVGSVNTGGTIAQRALRIGKQGDAIVAALPDSVRLVMVEALPFKPPKYSGLYQERCALLLDLVRFLARRRIPVIDVPATTLKMFATGNGHAEKVEVIDAMTELWPGAKVHNDNEADALTLGTIGGQKLGWYEPELPCHYSPKVDWTGAGL
ncbi:crossover junction endodeoxyribonuclease RuvC [Rhodococcoides fascians]|uniref:crossover junction endodeoxyribonuclease RuvC n=1 Tax=Rhodococcoides fascians TaxID=1828 RepID=UPI0027D84DD2|nr:crossover junction endodeoxyribonuclease RuvC [Rhodococcus fascians]